MRPLLTVLLLLALGAVLPASAQPPCPPPNAAWVCWDMQPSAVQSLWNARKLYGATWAPGATYANLAPAIRDRIAIGAGRGTNLQATPDSVYLIPQVDVGTANLPRALHQVASALLRLDTGNAKFYPSYTDSAGKSRIVNSVGGEIGTYIAFLGAGTRSRHDNALRYLPTVVVPACPAAVGAAVTTAWNRVDPATSAKARALDALNQQSGNTNRAKWHCLAMRAAPPGVTDFTTASGYMEFDHPDGADREYRESNEGRIVYDYVNGRVYYTPTHYRPTWRDATGAVQLSPDNRCPLTRTCASPFFELVR